MGSEGEGAPDPTTDVLLATATVTSLGIAVGKFTATLPWILTISQRETRRLQAGRKMKWLDSGRHTWCRRYFFLCLPPCAFLKSVPQCAMYRARYTVHCAALLYKMWIHFQLCWIMKVPKVELNKTNSLFRSSVLQMLVAQRAWVVHTHTRELQAQTQASYKQTHSASYTQWNCNVLSEDRCSVLCCRSRQRESQGLRHPR